MNDFCSDWPNVSLNTDLYHAFLAAYQQVRPLTDDEQQVLPTFLAMAATRFWLSRLSVARRNAEEGRMGDDVLQKDPQEMLNMVKARLAWGKSAKIAQPWNPPSPFDKGGEFPFQRQKQT